eukprot:1373874-Pyramimonas_sp.AAC.1
MAAAQGSRRAAPGGLHNEARGLPKVAKTPHAGGDSVQTAQNYLQTTPWAPKTLHARPRGAASKPPEAETAP